MIMMMMLVMMMMMMMMMKVWRVKAKSGWLECRGKEEVGGEEEEEEEEDNWGTNNAMFLWMEAVSWVGDPYQKGGSTPGQWLTHVPLVKSLKEVVWAVNGDATACVLAI